MENQCTKCGEKKDIDEFLKCGQLKSGYRNICKPCYRKYRNELKDPEKAKKRRTENKLSFEEKKANGGIPTEKKCGKCTQIRTSSEFTFSRSAKDGLRNQCKYCDKKLRQENKELFAERSEAWRKKNRERVNALARERDKKNPEKKAKRWNNWRTKNKERYREILSERNKKILSTPFGRLNNAMRVSINRSLNGYKNGASWLSLVGYSIQDLKKHIEKQFKVGMSWDNYGLHGWHVDHIRPIASFEFSGKDCKQFKDCWSLKNLQPMWAKENRIKGAKYEHPQSTTQP